jgi:hypothetical protein
VTALDDLCAFHFEASSSYMYGRYQWGFFELSFAQDVRYVVEFDEIEIEIRPLWGGAAMPTSKVPVALRQIYGATVSLGNGPGYDYGTTYFDPPYPYSGVFQAGWNLNVFTHGDYSVASGDGGSDYWTGEVNLPGKTILRPEGVTIPVSPDYTDQQVVTLVTQQARSIPEIPGPSGSTSSNYFASVKTRGRWVELRPGDVAG